MTHTGSLLIAFGESRVAVHWDGRLAFDIIHFLFTVREECKSCEIEASFTVKGHNPEQLQCYRNDELLFCGDAEKAAAKLLDAVIHELAQKCSGGLLFHAAAVSRKGFGILLPGQSGSGKTLLSAWLTRQGYQYLTDEMALVESQALGMHGFCKPLHIKDATIPGLNAIIEKPDQKNMHPSNGILSIDRGFLVDSSYLNSATGPWDSRTGMIIFPEFKSGGTGKMIRLTPANTGLLLMKSLINARNLPSHGFDQIALLARKVPAYTIAYEDFLKVFNEIDALIDS